MRISIGADHRGVSIKGQLIQNLEQLGHQVVDEGATDAQSSDYPDFAAKVAEKVSRGDVDRGVLICGTGVGMAIAANKFPGVRAAPVNDEFFAEICRRHNDTNVLCLSADLVGEGRLNNLVQIWLNTEFEGGRHARRVEKIADLERKLKDPQGDSA